MISTSVATGLTYCCCSLSGSLCNACCGNSDANSGRQRSVGLLTLAIVLSLLFQYWLAPYIKSHDKSLYYIYKVWYDNCPDDFKNQCAANAGALRPTAVSSLLFLLLGIITKLQPRFNQQAWPSKYGLFLIAVLVTIFLSNALFTGFFLWLARIGATLFVLLQQIILIDVAYNWNEDWVDRADQADRLIYGSGSVWYRAIVAVCVLFYATTLVTVGLLYHYFSGCAENTWIITLTLLGIVALTATQLSGTEGSLLTSSIMSLYAIFLAYSMVSKNPNATCNPQLGSNDVYGIVIGLSLTAVSLAWTGWSWTAQERLNVDAVQSTRTVNSSSNANLDVPFLDPGDAPTSGVVMDAAEQDEDGEGSADSEVWKLNMVMALISCWVAMILTGWGALTSDSDEPNIANPTAGRFNMAMIGISQWCAILLYIWTLIAPVLFPDRDFS